MISLKVISSLRVLRIVNKTIYGKVCFHGTDVIKFAQSHQIPIPVKVDCTSEVKQVMWKGNETVYTESMRDAANIRTAFVKQIETRKSKGLWHSCLHRSSLSHLNALQSY